MNKNDAKYKAFVHILNKELITAMGCTEPIALAFACAKAREILGTLPEWIRVQASGSIIKNIKSAVVPNTGGLKGMEAAAAAGALAGRPEKMLEVIADVKEEDHARIRSYMDQAKIKVEYLNEGHDFDMIVTVGTGENRARIRIRDQHTNIVLIERNDEVIYQADLHDADAVGADYSLLDMKNIWEFVCDVDIEDVRPRLDEQIRCNMAIAEEGLKNLYGANIGKVLLTSFGDGIANRARALAAAGSDARMNGCALPVVINSGSGNQGITCSVPVIEYARELESSEEHLYRALVLSNLISICIKRDIGTLSAYCGAVNAGAGAGAGIAYLYRQDYEDIIHTVVNCLAIVSGIVCDGAKASCAGKIASCVDAAILSYHMFRQGQEFVRGDGIVQDGIDPTIAGIGRLGREGMRETNEEIIRIMLK